MIISRTPFRISFFGGGTDYPSWYREHGGAVLATTIDKYCYLTCRYLPPFFEHRFRTVYSRIENCNTIDEIAHPAVREILRYMRMERGVEIHHDGDLPARSGMGSSSAFTVGLLNALHALEGRISSKQQLTAESIRVEQEVLKEAVGSQDQVLAAHGGFNHIVFSPSGDIAVRPVTLPRERIEELSAHLMLFFTGVSRTASEIAKSYVSHIEDHQPALSVIRDLVDQSITILSGGSDVRCFGELLHESWRAKRSLSPMISSAHTDEIYEAALAAGAIGGKLTGAGGGGFMLLFVPPDLQARVRERLSGLIYIPFKFEFSGSQIIFFDPEIDYAVYDKVRMTQVLRPFQNPGDPTRQG